MSEYNPIDTLLRLEAAGVDHDMAASFATEFTKVRADLVTKSDLEAALAATTQDLKLAMNALTLRVCAANGVMIALGFSILEYLHK
jgi:hypothetical protein